MEYASAKAGLVLVTANLAFQAREVTYAQERSCGVAFFCFDALRGNPMIRIDTEIAVST